MIVNFKLPDGENLPVDMLGEAVPRKGDHIEVYNPDGDDTTLTVQVVVWRIEGEALAHVVVHAKP